MIPLRAGSRFLTPFARSMSSARAGAGVVPVIDLGEAWKGNKERDLAVARQIGEACENIGFLSIVNHQIEEKVIDDIWKATRAFFDLPEAEKIASSKMTKDYPYGYSPIGGETLAAGKEKGRGGDSMPPASDLKESFSVGPSNPAAGMPPIQWPSRPQTFKPAYEAYYNAMETLSTRMLEMFALALHLPRDWFSGMTDKHRSVIRALNYPDISAPPLPGQLRASAHTDYGTMTILKPDNAPGGLQVLTKSNEWVDVHIPDGAFVVNLGDLMARWTNDKWVSTMHRVRLPEPDKFGSCRRQSIAFFQNINADTVVECIPTCMSPSNPPKYPPITAFEHLMQKHLASVGGMK